MKRELKKPSDYPLFYFRLKNQAEKEGIELALQQALAAANKSFKKGQKNYTKGEILKTALQEGLNLVRKGKLKVRE